MKTIRKIGSVAIHATVATVIAACSANPLLEESGDTKKTVAEVSLVTDTKKTSNETSKPKQAQSLAKKRVTVAKVNKKTSSVSKQTKVAQVSAKKPVSRAKTQPARARIIPVVKKRVSKQVASRPQTKRQVVQVAPKHVNKPVRRPVKIAARANRQLARPPIRVASRARAVAKVTPNYRKVAFRKPVQRRVTVRRATPRKAILRKANPRIHVSRIDNHAFGKALSQAAINRTKHRVRYDGSYVKISYPWGDVPKSIGVCTDVVIRSYRQLGIDLQQEVHKDIKNDFYAYPNLVKWGLEKPDPNIDHRRVYNLQAFFKRHKAELPRSRNPRDYKPGDLVTWMVGPTFPHIGVVVDIPTPSNPNRLMISHNVGAGPMIEDILFRFPMTGHYRYTPKHQKVNPALHFAKAPVPASVRRKQQKRSMSYKQLLEASRFLKIASAPLKSAANLTIKKLPAKIYLSQLSLATSPNANLNSAAVRALLK